MKKFVATLTILSFIATILFIGVSITGSAISESAQNQSTIYGLLCFIIGICLVIIYMRMKD